MSSEVVMTFRSSTGCWRTKSMFFERVEDKDLERFKPPYSLLDQDREENGVVYKSLYRLYMEAIDEYAFATEHLGGLDHWRALCRSKWFTLGHGAHRGSSTWQEDMRARDESTARKVLLLAAQDGDISAARKVYDISKPPVESKRGRFKKEEVIKEAAKKVEDRDFLDNAALRLNVVSIRD